MLPELVKQKIEENKSAMLDTLQTLIGIPSVATAAPDPIRGNVVKATVVLAKGYEPSEALTKELQNHVKHTTAPYKYPRIIEYVEELPKTLGGKIKRAQIRKEDFAKKN